MIDSLGEVYILVTWGGQVWNPNGILTPIVVTVERGPI